MRKPAPPPGIALPGLKWRPRRGYWIAYWIPRHDRAEAGYPIKSRRLWHPVAGGSNQPTLEEWQAMSLLCETLQDEMLTWTPKPVAYDPAALFSDGTFASLARIYLTDRDSPFKELRHHTARTYDRQIGYIVRDIGEEKIGALTFRDFKRWHADWAAPVEGMKPRISNAHERMKFVRIVMSFGALLKLPGVADAKSVLDEMEFTNPKARREIVNEAQTVAIRIEANRRGFPSIALTQALQWSLMVRQKDAIGEWLPIAEPVMSDVLAGGEKWANGFRWENLDANMRLTHRLSKSIHGKRALSNPDEGKVKVWTLTLYPMVMDELALIAGCSPAMVTRDMLPAAGAMIVAEGTNRPWQQKSFAQRWRAIASDAGVPDHVQNRDSRAGGNTDAEIKGADENTRRKALGHTKPETTRIYDRDEAETEARITRIRFGKDT